MFFFSQRRKALRVLSLVFFAGASLMAGANASAADYPDKPIRLLVPYTAGGVTDLVARQLARLLERDLKQPLVVENKPGANGTLGASQLIGARPDGYLLSIVPVGIFRQPLIETMALDPMKHLTYISSLVDYNYFIVVRSDAPWRNVKDFVASMKSAKGCNYATPGVYSSPHLAMEEFQKVATFSCTHVPYKGAADVTSALLGGQLDVIATSGGGTLDGFLSSGRLRLLASLGASRTPMYPQVSTLKENGYEVSIAAPFGLVGPAGMDPATVTKLSSLVDAAMKDRSMIDLVNKNSAVVQFMGPKDYLSYANQTWATEKQRFAQNPALGK